MAACAGDGLLSAAWGVLPAEEAELLTLLHAFTRERLDSAERARRQLLVAPDAGAPAGGGLHGFLRECWDVLDGLAREVNLCMHHQFPEVGLFPPLAMTRQCTFYVVRRTLHEHPDTADHGVSRLLWERTREAPEAAYVRLSFLYNLSLFVPVAVLEGGLLPGTEDVPAVLRGIVRQPQTGVQACGTSGGTAEILEWLRGLLSECYGRLCSSLEPSEVERPSSPQGHGAHGEQ